MSAFSELLAAEFAPYGSLSQGQLNLLEAHYALLMHWNKRLNLTRITELSSVVRLHYCESLFLGLHLPKVVELRIADVGSGAGFPGIPVAVVRPDCSVDLIESHARKAVFLSEASRVLPNVCVISRRAEECSAEYDWIVSRAVRPAEVLALDLAPKAALLLNSEEAQGIGGEIFDLPWGEKHALLLTNVPRGTAR